MGRALVTLRTDADRERVIQCIKNAPAGTRVELNESKRSNAQNDRMWMALERVAKLEWQGMRYSSSEWKDYFMHAYRGAKWMPFEEGGMIPIGRSTSKLSKGEFAELMTLIETFCARRSIILPWDER